MHESGWHEALPLSDLPDGSSKEIRLGIASVLLIRQGEHLYAVSPLCPHKFTPLSQGDIEIGSITCALHAACFDLGTGRPQPGNDWAGQLPVYPTRIREGMIHVQLPSLE